MNLGIDLHDTISYRPEFFKTLLKDWPFKRYIVSGTPQSQEKETIEILNSYGITQEYYDKILLGYEYDKTDMNLSHFKRMREHKLKLIKQYDIKVFFDDNPFYASYLKDHTAVFQTILSSEYLESFKQKDPFFTCNFQADQFNYLEELDNDKIKKTLNN